MSTTTTTTTTATEAAPQTIQLTTPMIPKPSGPNRLFTHPGRKFGDWRDELEQNGYTVVKGAIPRDRADKYADDVLSYLENLYVSSFPRSHSYPHPLFKLTPPTAKAASASTATTPPQSPNPTSPSSRKKAC